MKVRMTWLLGTDRVRGARRPRWRNFLEVHLIRCENLHNGPKVQALMDSRNWRDLCLSNPSLDSRRWRALYLVNPSIGSQRWRALCLVNPSRDS